MFLFDKSPKFCFSLSVENLAFSYVFLDSNSKINAVMFAGRRKSLDFIPEVGMRVLVKCSVTLFEREGRFQLSVFSLEPLGEGILDVKFRQLREKLELEGLFSKERKS